MTLRRYLLVLIALMLVPMSGCIPKAALVTVPKQDITLEKATEINLKILDLTKITSGETKDVLGYHFESIEGAKIIEYRYMKKPITVKVAKFNSTESAQDFWLRWTDFLLNETKIVNLKEDEEEKSYWEFRTLNNQVIAWQKDLWFIFVEVPIEFPKSTELSNKVVEIVNMHFQSLNTETK